MKAYLLYADRDFNWDVKEKEYQTVLAEDIQLEVIFRKMAGDDESIYDCVRKVILNPLTDADEVIYRQEVFVDLIKNRWFFDAIDGINGRIKEKREKSSGYASLLWDHPDSKVASGVEILTTYLDELKYLRKMAAENSGSFASSGFRAFFQRIENEMDEDFFRQVEENLSKCNFKDGVSIGMNIGEGLKSDKYALIEPDGMNMVERRLKRDKSVNSVSYKMDEPDTKEALTELREKGLNQTANALMQAADHVTGFFDMLNRELKFYKGAVNLMFYLNSLGVPVTFPKLYTGNIGIIDYSGLSDTALAIQKNSKVVGNEGHIGEKMSVVITGANQGGKTTFLRSIGQAILFCQAGIFVAAEKMSSGVYQGLCTHFRKEEDTTMKSGKLDEELSRLDKIVDILKPGMCVIFNESFASTNEREGSQIGWQVLKALEESGVRFFFVTHLYELSERIRQNDSNALFLRAQRLDDGSRSFKILEGYATRTGYGMDLFKQLFS